LAPFGTDEIKRHIELGKKLYDTLLQPDASQLRGKSKLIIVPDGKLYDLPFETLIANDGAKSSEKGPEQLQSLPYLVKDYTVTYAPSASVLVALENNRKVNHSEKVTSQDPLLAFGDPIYAAAPESRTVALNLRASYEGEGEFERLPHSAEEVQKIAEI